MRYDDLINNQIMSPSVAELLFDERKRSASFRSASFPAFAFNISLFYTVLVQAYVLAKSIKSGSPVGDGGYSSLMLENVKDTWAITEDRKGSSRDTKPWVFSFLTQCASSGDPSMFSRDASQKIAVAKNAVLEANKNARSFLALLTEEAFLDYVNALPLLKTTEIDWNRMRFVFHTENSQECYSIDCQPFLYFWNNKKNVRSLTRTGDCYVITSLRKGKQLGELTPSSHNTSIIAYLNEDIVA